MNLIKELELLKEYFKGMETHEDVFFVKLEFPLEWSVYDSTQDGEENNDLVQAIRNKKNPSEVFFYTKNVNNLGMVFTHIHKVIDYNKELVEKMNLLESKANELKELFKNESLSKLKKLTFTFKNKK